MGHIVANDKYLTACNLYDKLHGTNLATAYLKLKKKDSNCVHHMDPIFSFSRGGYFGGMLHYNIYFLGDALLFEGLTRNDFYSMKDYIFCLPLEEMESFANIIEELTWAREYKPEGRVFDGYGYTLKLSYKNISFYSQGYVELPPLYYQTVQALQEKIEDLCMRYAADYELDGITQRLEL